MAKIERPCQKSDTASGNERLRLKTLAIDHFKARGTASAFAARHGLPHTTVIGWANRWECDRELTKQGRPPKLAVYNESKVLDALRGERRFLDWKSVRNQIQAQSGEVMSRRAVIRLLQRWRIYSGRDAEVVGFKLMSTSWHQPETTVPPGSVAHHATLWKLMSGRGLEKFLFTGTGGGEATGLVKRALEEWQGERRSRREARVLVCLSPGTGAASQKVGTLFPESKFPDSSSEAPSETSPASKP